MKNMFKICSFIYEHRRTIGCAIGVTLLLLGERDAANVVLDVSEAHSAV